MQARCRPDGRRVSATDGGSGVFSLWVDKVSPGESARNLPAIDLECAGVVSVGVLYLSPQDIEAQRELAGGGAVDVVYSSSLAASMGKRPSKPAFEAEGRLA